jgi:predicted metalloprotease with PDZ domain
VFIAAVAEDGPLAKAGIFEGSRIASINGVDLRVPAADAGDEFMTSARVRRLTREIEKLEPGGKADLRVYTNGQYRNVSVNAVKRSDLKQSPGITIFGSDGGLGMILRRSGDGTELMLDRMRMDMGHLFRDDARREIEAVIRAREIHFRDTLRNQLDELREAQEAARRALEEAARAVRSRSGSAVGTAAPAAFTTTADLHARSFGPLLRPAVHTTATAFRNETAPEQGAAFSVGGVRLSRVDAPLARYLGAGSENGLLVLEVEPRWSGIRAGDVLLSIDGRAVRMGDSSRVALDNGKSQQVELIRDGKRITTALTGR